MPQLSLKQIAHFLAIKNEVPEIVICSYCVDSRKVKKGDLFFALEGAKTDGHEFLQEVREKGAIAAVVSHTYTGTLENFPLLQVQNPLKSLQMLAKNALSLLSARIVGITGSLGKTTVKEFVQRFLRTNYCVTASPGNSNSQIGLPLTILNHTTGNEEILVLEMGMTHKGQISQLVQIAPPEVAVVTCVDLVHACNFETLDDIAQSKAEILQHSAVQLGIIDDQFLDFSHLSKTIHCPVHTISSKENCADYTLISTTPLQIFSRIDNKLLNIENFNIPGKHNLQNLLIAIAVARYFKVSWENIVACIPNLQLPEQRLQFETLKGIRFINDSYNASESSVKSALEAVPQPQNAGKKIAVLGSIMELGKFSYSCHTNVGQYALNFVDECYCYGEECQPIFDLWKKVGKPVHLFFNFSDLIDTLQKKLKPHDVVLIKGSRSKQLEKVLDVFK